MTSTERYAAILHHTIIEALIKPSFYSAASLRLLLPELHERIAQVRDEDDVREEAELPVLEAFVTYLETLIAQRTPKA